MTTLDLPALLARHGVTLANMPGNLPPAQTALRLARDAVLRELVASGMTTGEVAAALSLSRPSITDRCHRLGITPRHDPGKRRGWAGAKAARAAAARAINGPVGERRPQGGLRGAAGVRGGVDTGGDRADRQEQRAGVVPAAVCGIRGAERVTAGARVVMVMEEVWR